MQKQEKKFFEGHRSTLWIEMLFGIKHPPPTHQLQSTCMGEGSRVPNLQTEFNYLDSFKSYGIFSDFVVPTWSPLSPSSPCRPRIIPVISTSSLSSPHHLHIVPIIPRRSPCGLHGLWSPHVVPIVPVIPTSSLSSPRHLHVVPIISTSSPSSPEGPHGSMVCGLHMLSTSSPHRPCHPHVIPTSSRRSPHHPQPPRYPLHPPPGGWGPQISKNAIRFELIKIF